MDPANDDQEERARAGWGSSHPSWHLALAPGAQPESSSPKSSRQITSPKQETLQSRPSTSNPNVLLLPPKPRPATGTGRTGARTSPYPGAQLLRGTPVALGLVKKSRPQIAFSVYSPRPGPKRRSVHKALAQSLAQPTCPTHAAYPLSWLPTPLTSREGGRGLPFMNSRLAGQRTGVSGSKAGPMARGPLK